MPNMESIQVGDEVRISAGGWRTSFAIGKVDRLTKTQFIIGTQRFRRDCGRMVGGDAWTSCTARPATDEDRVELADTRKRNKSINLIADTRFRELSTEQLQEIERIISADPGQ